MLKNEILKENIDIINMPKPIINLMKNNNILLVEDLCNTTKSDIKRINLSFHEINKIDIKLQIMVVCLKGSI